MTGVRAFGMDFGDVLKEIVALVPSPTVSALIIWNAKETLV
jgi:hypothetical protein